MMTETIRKTKGCQEIQAAPIHRIGQDLSFQTCIGNFFSAPAVAWLELHNRFERGMLPFPGSLYDQPSKVMEIFRVIEMHKAERMEAEQKRAKEQERRNHRGVHGR